MTDITEWAILRLGFTDNLEWKHLGAGSAKSALAQEREGR